ncbi:MAG: hypothetical protein WA637_07070 [Terriglobales bacterium]
MKAIRIAITLLFVLATTAAFAASAAQKSFEELKALDGSWEGTVKNGQPVEVDYRLTSGGSALMSEIKGKEDMITMFHLDGDRLLMTHYCGAGNQPRMVASASPDGKTFTFSFLDATNLATPDAAHMHRLVISMPDANHHTEEWVFTDHGKEVKEVFDLRRKQ